MRAKVAAKMTQRVAIRICTLISLMFGGAAQAADADLDFSPFQAPNFIEQVREAVSENAFDGWKALIENPELLRTPAEIDPQTLNSFMQTMTGEPFLRLINSADSEPVRREYIRSWFDFSANPQWVSQVMPALQPQVRQQWLRAMTSPEWMRTVLGQLDTAYYNQWVGAITEPKVLDSMMRLMEPQMVMDMMTGITPVMANPQK